MTYWDGKAVVKTVLKISSPLHHHKAMLYLVQSNHPEFVTVSLSHGK